MSLRNQNWINFNGEPVTGRTPTRVRVSADRPGLVMNAQQEGFVAHAYKLFCDAVKFSAFPDGFHVQNRVAPDGTQVRMESNLGVHRVFVKIRGKDSEFIEVFLHGIGVCFTDIDGLTVPTYQREVESVLVPQPLILTPGVTPTFESDGSWKKKKVPILLGGQKVWTSKNKKHWYSQFAPCPDLSWAPFAIGSSYPGGDNDADYNLTVRNEWVYDLGGLTYGEGDFVFQKNDTVARTNYEGIYPVFRTTVTDGGTTTDYLHWLVGEYDGYALYRRDTKPVKGLNLDDDPPASAKFELVVKIPLASGFSLRWNGAAVNDTGTKVYVPGFATGFTPYPSKWVVFDVGASLSYTVIDTPTGTVNDAVNLTRTVASSFQRSVPTTTPITLNVEPYPGHPETYDRYDIPVDSNAAFTIASDSPTASGHLMADFAYFWYPGYSTELAFEDTLTQHVYEVNTTPGGNELTGRFFIREDAGGSPVWGYFREYNRTTRQSTRTFTYTSDDPAQVVERYTHMVVDTCRGGGEAEFENFILPLAKTSGNYYEQDTLRDSVTQSYHAWGNIAHEETRVLAFDRVSGTVVAYRQVMSLTYDVTDPAVLLSPLSSPHQCSLVVYNAAGEEIFSQALGSFDGGAYVARYAYHTDPTFTGSAPAPTSSISTSSFSVTEPRYTGPWPQVDGDDLWRLDGEITKTWNTATSTWSRSDPQRPGDASPFTITGNWSQMPRNFFEVKWAKDPITNAMLVNVILRRSAMTGPGYSPTDESWMLLIDSTGCRTLQSVFPDIPANVMIWQDALLNSLVSI